MVPGRSRSAQPSEIAIVESDCPDDAGSPGTVQVEQCSMQMRTAVIPPHCVLLHAAGELLMRQLKNIAWTQRQIGICRAESPRNSEPDRATLSIAQGVSPGYGVVIRPEPRQLAGWQIRMSVPFMLSIDYLHINAHPYLPPTRLGLRVSGYACACYALTGRSGFGYYFHFTPGLPSSPCGLRRDRSVFALRATPRQVRPGLLNLSPRQ